MVFFGLCMQHASRFYYLIRTTNYLLLRFLFSEFLLDTTVKSYGYLKKVLGTIKVRIFEKSGFSKVGILKNRFFSKPVFF